MEGNRKQGKRGRREGESEEEGEREGEREEEEERGRGRGTKRGRKREEGRQRERAHLERDAFVKERGATETQNHIKQCIADARAYTCEHAPQTTSGAPQRDVPRNGRQAESVLPCLPDSREAICVGIRVCVCVCACVYTCVCIVCVCVHTCM